MSKVNDYWRKREEEALQHYITDEREYDKQVKGIYADMMDNCQREIDSFYGKYAAKEGISIAEAQKRVSRLDIDAYERKARRYVEEKDFSDFANKEMRLYNATMRINRLEMLKANIGLELISGHDKLEKFMERVLKGRTNDELSRQAGILGKSIRGNANMADKIVNASFHNATYSQRVWANQSLLKNKLSSMLQTGLIQGKNPRTLARELQKTFGASVYDSERLMRTELARVQTDAQKKSFEANGYDEYEFIANSGCCSTCLGLNGKHFKVEKMMPGENAAPLHPNCRCSVAAYMDNGDYEEWLDYLDKGGSSESWQKLKNRVSQIEKNPGKILEKPYNSGIITLNNKSVREWYINAASRIKDNLDSTGSVEAQARQAFGERNRIRITAREMMDDKDARSKLYSDHPNPTFEELLEKKMKLKHLTRDEAIRDIYETAIKTNADVDNQFGL